MLWYSFQYAVIEFIYAQSPAGMKGLLLGCMFGTEGLSMGIAGVLVLLHNLAPKYSVYAYFANANNYYKKITHSPCIDRPPGHECMDSAMSTFVVFALVATLSIIFFVIVALRYKYRRRDLDPYLPIWLIPSTDKKEGLCRRILKMCCS